MIKIPPQATIILSRPDRIGDVVITSSCFDAIRKKYPSARIYLLARSELQPLFTSSENLTGFLPLPEGKDTLSTLTQMFRQLKPDVIVHFHPHPECHQAASEAKIEIRMGWGEDRCLTHAFPDTRKEGKKHEGFYNFDLLRDLGIEPPKILHPEIHPANEAQASLLRKLPWDIQKTNYIVLNPTTAREIRLWPTERFAELSKWIANELNFRIVSIGASAVDPVMLEFNRLTKNHDILRLEGKLDLAELAWLLEKTKSLITCDTGPSHIAAAMNAPQVTIFGRNEPAYGPARWRALNEKVEILIPSIQKRFWETKRQFWKRGFASISVNQVKEASKKFF